ncbi:Non-specific serine/threonine protein kinase protein [Dioscorea alata]|uniref:Non-specific serine/threonine protein kinase protein n=1 Tax=Dioscorea alata TaxID=55571 RepID=A0ACB7W4D3_DIOAL|nr:Non-specific serine/threonine protein kinase protein [Dioscorea alata]
MFIDLSVPADKEAKTGGGQAPKKQNNDPSPSKKKEGPDNSLTRPRPGIAFTYPTLEKATNQFSRANFLGKGGFGPVHKGVGVLPFDIEIAVKQLEFGSQQGDDEFEAEVKIISRVHHRHLVTLFGHCISRKKRLLVYEFVPNKTLHFHLHGEGQPAMELPIRLKIALGTARGLAYLHDDCHPMIIHRDIKAANILLDSKFEAKVADFGLARFAYDHETHVLTSKLKGTFGYFAPEYAASGELSDKSDVYAFGVMLLELITGRVPVDRRPSNNTLPVVLVDWAKPRLKHALEGKYKPLVDPRLPKNYNPNEMARMVACAAACVRHSAKHRPRMSLVVQVLGGVVSPENLNDDVPPVRSGRT